VHEIAAGPAYKDANITVTAFDAHHGSIPAYGYRFEAPDRAVVIGGDGSGKNEAPENCRRCDLLIAEAYTLASFEMVSPQWKQYRQAFHPSSKELANVANRTKPATLVLYHFGNAGCDQMGTQACRDAGSEMQLLAEIRKLYKDRAVAAHDLDVY
jgi:ribonuclease BN (tRNA processing enzyme)